MRLLDGVVQKLAHRAVEFHEPRIISGKQLVLDSATDHLDGADVVPQALELLLLGVTLATLGQDLQ